MQLSGIFWQSAWALFRYFQAISGKFRKSRVILGYFGERKPKKKRVLINKNNKNNNKLNPGFRFALCWITKAKAKGNFWNFHVFRQCGLLLGLVRVQHVHHESTCKSKSGGVYLFQQNPKGYQIIVTCSLCRLDFVKEFPRFGRDAKIS